MNASLLIALMLLGARPDTPIEAKLLRVTTLWNKSPHAAFTDLIFWKDRFVCVFRSGQKHVSPDGSVVVLTSSDGVSFTQVAIIRSTHADLRDPKLTIGHRGELMLLAAGAMHDKAGPSHRNFCWTSEDGITWSNPVEIGEPNSWLWRVTSHATGLYGWGYGISKERFIRLYRNEKQGAAFSPITPQLLQERGYPNESAMVMEGNHAWCLLRRDGKSPHNTALFGSSLSPFAEWTWKDLGVQIGGPSMLRLPGGQFLTTVRLYTPKVRTALCLLDPAKPELRELLTLPSGGDCSYAGMVWHQQKLWISYYSSHEGKSAIYLAEVEVKQE